MANESLKWRELANDMLLSFGDVVRNAIVLVESDTSTYDPTKGTMVKSQVRTSTKVVPTQFKFKLFGREKYQDEDRSLMVRGSDFSAPVKPGARIAIYKEDGTTIEGRYVVVQSAAADAGTGALFYLHVRKSGTTFEVSDD